MKYDIYRMWIVEANGKTTYAEGHLKNSDSTIKFSITFDNDMLLRELGDEDFAKSQVVGHLFNLSGDKIEFDNTPDFTDEEISKAMSRAKKWYDSLLESGAFSGQ